MLQTKSEIAAVATESKRYRTFCYVCHASFGFNTHSSHSVRNIYQSWVTEDVSLYDDEVLLVTKIITVFFSHEPAGGYLVTSISSIVNIWTWTLGNCDGQNSINESPMNSIQSVHLLQVRSLTWTLKKDLKTTNENWICSKAVSNHSPQINWGQMKCQLRHLCCSSVLKWIPISKNKNVYFSIYKKL